MAKIDTDLLQQLAESLTATPRLQDGAALAGAGLLQPLAQVRTRSARRELTRLRRRTGERSDAARRQAALVAALATRESEVADQVARLAAPQAEAGAGEAALSGRVTRDGVPLVDAEVVALDAKGQALGRTCTSREGRYALAVPADTDLRFEVREGGKPRYRDKNPAAWPPGYRGRRDIEIGRADPVCDPATPPEPGAERLQMPDVVGLPREQALRAIEALGLRVAKEVQKRSDRPGIVLEQQPEAGARVAPQADVVLTVGRQDGSPAADLGELKGKTLNTALETMAQGQVALGSVTIVPGRGRTPVVRQARAADVGDALHLEVAMGGDKAAEVDVAALLIGASPEGLAIGLDSAAEARRWLDGAGIASLADVVEAAGEDDAALRKRLGLDARAKVADHRRALVAAASRITRG